MEKVYHFETPREHYHADAAVVWCFDDRFTLGFQKFLKRQGMVRTDVIKIAGGAKYLAAADVTERDFVLDQIRTSIRLHGTKRVILVLHSDCGAYGGLKHFNGDADAEAGHHQQELRRAAANVKKMIPGVEVDTYFVNFEGVWKAPQEAVASSG